MWHGRARRTTVVAALSAGAALLASAAPAEATWVERAPSPIYRTVASHLHNPRSVAFSSTGAMYVAEAGRGGSGRCLVSDQRTVLCFGRTGSVTRVAHGRQRRVIRGLASLGGKADGSMALGPAGLVTAGKHALVLSVGFGAAPGKRRLFPKAGRTQFAHLLAFDLSTGRRTVLGDLGHYEGLANPVDAPDTDPTGVARAGSGSYLVTDAGGDTLLRVRRGVVGGVRRFGDRRAGVTTYHAEPSDVVRGPDGAWYVSELTGTPSPRGAARIWRVVPGHRPTVWASGLTAVTSLAWWHRRLYAVQLSDAGTGAGYVGSLLRVRADSSGKRDRTIAADLPSPYGLAMHRGAAFVSIGSIQPTGGSVIRIPLP
jgi:hypothetical protein